MTSYTDPDIMVPYLLEDILYYTPHISGFPQVDPELYYWPTIANCLSFPIGDIELSYFKDPTKSKFSPNPPLKFPFTPKYRDNLRTFNVGDKSSRLFGSINSFFFWINQDENGTHLLHASGEFMNDICISDLYKYGSNIKKLATYKCPINCPGDIYQIQLSEGIQLKSRMGYYSNEIVDDLIRNLDLKDYRMMINQMYTCSIVDIIRQGPEEYTFKPIEILQYSKKIADSTMFKPTGSVVVLSETGELTLWNGGESVIMLHKPQSETPMYGMNN
jgi:hypothetical protein